MAIRLPMARPRAASATQRARRSAPSGPRPAEAAGQVEALWRRLVDDGPPTCVIGPDQKRLYANPACERLAPARAEAGLDPAQVENGD
ncbi:MAG: hypothetical protein ACE5DS_01935, partial [Kiloniellaceae bacterium]